MRTLLRLVTFGALCIGSVHATESSAEVEVRRLVRERGAKVAVSRLFGTPKWDALISGIASGDPVWLEIAKDLAPGTDGGSTSELQDAVAWALPHAPGPVLALVKLGFPWRNTCSGPPVDFPPTGSKRYFESAIAAVEKVGSEVGSEIKQNCLRSLRSAAANAETRQ
jgi:hypothetical protein